MDNSVRRSIQSGYTGSCTIPLVSDDEQKYQRIIVIFDHHSTFQVLILILLLLLLQVSAPPPQSVASVRHASMHAALLQQHAALANQANVISQQGSYKTRSDKLEVQQKPVNVITLNQA